MIAATDPPAQWRAPDKARVEAAAPGSIVSALLFPAYAPAFDFCKTKGADPTVPRTSRVGAHVVVDREPRLSVKMGITREEFLALFAKQKDCVRLDGTDAISPPPGPVVSTVTTASVPPPPKSLAGDNMPRPRGNAAP